MPCSHNGGGVRTTGGRVNRRGVGVTPTPHKTIRSVSTRSIRFELEELGQLLEDARLGTGPDDALFLDTVLENDHGGNAHDVEL